MSKVNAVIESMKRVEVKGVEKVLMTLANGDQRWLSESYVDKILKSADLEGARIGALVGCVVSYEKITHKAGEIVKNNGVEVAGKTYEKDGYSIEKFEVTRLGEVAESFGDKYDNHIAKAKAKAKLSGSFSKFLTKAVITPEGVAATVKDEVEEEEGL